LELLLCFEGMESLENFLLASYNDLKSFTFDEKADRA
jgi:hypothetical protein